MNLPGICRARAMVVAAPIRAHAGIFGSLRLPPLSPPLGPSTTTEFPVDPRLGITLRRGSLRLSARLIFRPLAFPLLELTWQNVQRLLAAIAGLAFSRRNAI